MTADGMGADANAALARDQALRSAQREAVAQVVGVYVNAETRVKDTELIESKILTQSSGFISKYEILKEQKEQKGNDAVVRVTIRAEVWVRKLSDTLSGNCSELQVRGGQHRILIALSGKSAEAAVTHLQEKMTNPEEFGEVNVLDESQLQDNVQPIVRKLRDSQTLTSTEVNQLNQHADIVVLGSATVGNATSANVGDDKDLLTAKSTLNARVLWTGNGRIVSAGSVTEGGNGFGEEIAQAEAVKRAVEVWEKKCLCKVKVALMNPACGYEIKVSGAFSLDRIQRFVDSLRQLRFAQEVRLRSFDAKGSWVDVVYGGDAENLIRELKPLGAKVDRLGNRTILTMLRAK